MLDGVCACINRRFDANCAGGVHRNFQVLTVSLIHDHRHFRHRHVVLNRNLDQIDVVETIFFHCLPRSVGAVYLQKFLLQDRLGKRGIEILDIPIFTLFRKFTSGCSILGPGTRPALIASRSATSPPIPECPRLCTVVNPLSRSSRASCAPSNTRLLGDSMIGSKNPGANSPLYRRPISASAGTVTSRSRCVWGSISPGNKIALPKSMVLTPVGVSACTRESVPTSLILSFSISTAAGESTFPVRGSRRWPAFTRVMLAGGWAASCPVENSAKNDAANSMNCLRMSTRSSLSPLPPK